MHKATRLNLSTTVGQTVAVALAKAVAEAKLRIYSRKKTCLLEILVDSNPKQDYVFSVIFEGHLNFKCLLRSSRCGLHLSDVRRVVK